MHMATTTRWWTAADLADLPEDGCRYEALEGELLVTPVPAFPHRVVTGTIVAMLAGYCRTNEIGVVVVPGVVRWRANELQPDIAVAPRPHARSASAGSDEPVLVIEIHSPSTRGRDRSVKRAAYMSLGIPEYWQVDIEERVVLVTRTGRGDFRAHSVLDWQPNPELPALEIDVPALFR
jgi:Uma2 family endonuclease